MGSKWCNIQRFKIRRKNWLWCWVVFWFAEKRGKIQGFIAISPPADKYDFSFLAPCPVSGLIIQGDNDDIVNETDVALFANELDSQKAITVKYKKIKNADHFFTDKLTLVSDEVRKYVQKNPD